MLHENNYNDLLYFITVLVYQPLAVADKQLQKPVILLMLFTFAYRVCQATPQTLSWHVPVLEFLIEKHLCGKFRHGF